MSTQKVATVFLILLFGSALLFGGTITRDFSESYRFDGDKVNVRTVNGNIFVNSQIVFYQNS